MARSIIKIQKPPHGTALISIPRNLVERLGDVDYLVPGMDEAGNLIYCPLRGV
jgi:hypothetical protein